jgi:hypothetical protein
MESKQELLAVSLKIPDLVRLQRSRWDLVLVFALRLASVSPSA